MSKKRTYQATATDEDGERFTGWNEVSSPRTAANQLLKAYDDHGKYRRNWIIEVFSKHNIAEFKTKKWRDGFRAVPA